MNLIPFQKSFQTRCARCGIPGPLVCQTCRAWDDFYQAHVAMQAALQRLDNHAEPRVDKCTA